MALALVAHAPRSPQEGSSSATHVLQSCNAKEEFGDASATFLPLVAIPGIRVIVKAETETRLSRKLIPSQDWGGLIVPMKPLF